MDWYLEVWRKYAIFSGRARRKEYWWFFLINLLVSIGLAIVDGITGSFSAETGMGLLGSLYALAVLIPGIAVSVRRLHDTERSGWWLLLAFVPVVGAIVLLVFLVQDGKPGANQYGVNPKGISA